jgi:hypothetical protein
VVIDAAHARDILRSDDERTVFPPPEDRMTQREADASAPLLPNCSVAHHN